MKLRVGTRRSPLALTQTRQAMDELQRRVPGLSYELVEVVTTGDRIQDRPLREAGGKGLFLKELDEALLDGRIDCAVHSMKDVPTDLAPGTRMAAVLERVDARDVLVTTDRHSLASLAKDAVIGTTSLRRQSQALAVLPSASVRLLRGNVQTRLSRLAEGYCDATFLAMAGLSRLGLRLGDGSGDTVPGVVLDPFVFVPAPGQGALAITARDDDEATVSALAVMDHGDSRLAVGAERAFAREFGGGCHLPLAAYAQRRGLELILVGVLLSADGRRTIRDEARLSLTAADAATDPATAAATEAAAEALGSSLGRSFFARGATELLELAAAAESPS